MGNRKPTFGASVQNALKGRTLRVLARQQISIAIICQDCAERTQWLWGDVLKNPRFGDLLDQPIDTIAARFRCTRCQTAARIAMEKEVEMSGRNVFVTVHTPRPQ